MKKILMILFSVIIAVGATFALAACDPDGPIKTDPSDNADCVQYIV